MNDPRKQMIWNQFGASIDMLESAIRCCPDAVWSDGATRPEFWYLAYHTLFWLDLYLYGPIEGFRPPEPFGIEELDPSGVMPSRVYERNELLNYLSHCREKLRTVITDLDNARLTEIITHGRRSMSYEELLWYNMRHVQHHVGQLNLLLRQETDSALIGFLGPHTTSRSNKCMNGVLFDLHLTTAEIEASMENVIASPKDRGSLEMIVCRPEVNKRKVLTAAELDLSVGLVGDNWLTRGSSRTSNGLGHPEKQLNLMNYRFALLIAGSRERVPLAGDQLFVDLDLGKDNLPAGTRLSIGSTVIEVTAMPHLGCKKFVERFGTDAMKYANSEFGRRHNLRGVNARVVTAGQISSGDEIKVIRHS